MPAHLVTSGSTPIMPSPPALLLRHDGRLQRPAVGAVELLLRAQEVLGEIELRLHQLGERHSRRGRQPVGGRRRSCESCFRKIRCHYLSHK